MLAALETHWPLTDTEGWSPGLAVGLRAAANTAHIISLSHYIITVLLYFELNMIAASIRGRKGGFTNRK